MSIALENLTKRFGDLAVVDEVQLKVADGELFVLLGASGSGKSTVLRLIAGLLTPDRGRVALQGRDVTWLPPQARGVGFVFQNYSIFRHMNVAENVEFGLRIRKVPGSERAERREELLHLVGLAGLGNRYVTQLSGGQQQRVALARALAYHPEVLLLDEPFSALDVQIRAQLRRTLKEIQRRLAVTTILVTHDQEEAFELADRIGVMERGRLLEVGTAEDLYYRPQTAFVATFVGSGTVLVGRVEDGAARLGSLRLPLQRPQEISEGAQVTNADDKLPEEGARVQVLIRPEQMELTAERPSGALPVLGQGTVQQQTFAGATRRVLLGLPRLSGTRQLAPHVPFGEEQMVMEAQLTDSRLRLPQEVWVSLKGWHILEAPSPQLLVYDRGTGPDTALHMARQLKGALQAAVTVLAVASDTMEVQRVREQVAQRTAAAGLEPDNLKVEADDPNTVILREETQVWYDVSLVPAAPGADRLIGSLLDGPRQTPLLVVRGERRELRKILICTAAGEPGKQDVRTGGRLARRLGAKVVLLHAVGTTPEPLATRHLERAQATLRAMDVQAESQTARGETPAAAILERARTINADMLVIGQHLPDLRLRWADANVMRDVVGRADRPVLVVPE